MQDEVGCARRVKGAGEGRAESTDSDLCGPGIHVARTWHTFLMRCHSHVCDTRVSFGGLFTPKVKFDCGTNIGVRESLRVCGQFPFFNDDYA